MRTHDQLVKKFMRRPCARAGDEEALSLGRHRAEYVNACGKRLVLQVA